MMKTMWNSVVSVEGYRSPKPMVVKEMNVK